MRKLSTSIVVPSLIVAGVLVAPLAAAQGETEDGAEEGVDAEPVTLTEGEEAPPVAPAETSTSDGAAAGASVSAAPSEASVGGVVQMGDVSAESEGPSGGGSASSANRSYGGPVSASEDEWKFGYNGYFRAPMRVGIGSRLAAKSDQSETTLSVPQVPSDQYLDWQYTKSVQRSWAEAFFSYGNKYAKGVLGMQAFRFSDATFPDPEAQFGISQAWVEVTPDLTEINEDLRMKAWVGNFWRRYGGAGKYDAGAYDTFIIGRTHVMGEAIRLEYDYSDMVFFFEEGFGTKTPNPSPFHNTKFTLLAHAHAGFNWDQTLDIGIHFMNAWTQEPDHDCVSREEEVQVLADAIGTDASDPTVVSLVSQFAEAPVGSCKHEVFGTGPTADQPLDVTTPTGTSRRADSPDGSLKVIGIDAVLNAGILGRIFAGFSHIIADHAITVAPAIEVIHANGGGFFKSGFSHQYLIERPDWENPVNLNRGGNGSVNSVAFQWDMSLSSIIGADTFGQQSLGLSLFGMLNMISSEDDAEMDGISKLKYGAELEYDPLEWFGAAFRFDSVNPRSDIPEQNFMVFAPRLVFRSSFATHETIEVGYAKYSYNTPQCTDTENLLCVQSPGGTVGPDGFGTRPGANSTKELRGTPVDIASERGPFPDVGFDPPHEDVFFVTASIWW